eukprot:453083-Hanusia_phi.AAC.2
MEGSGPVRLAGYKWRRVSFCERDGDLSQRGPQRMARGKKSSEQGEILVWDGVVLLPDVCQTVFYEYTDLNKDDKISLDVS